MPIRRIWRFERLKIGCEGDVVTTRGKGIAAKKVTLKTGPLKRHLPVGGEVVTILRVMAILVLSHMAFGLVGIVTGLVAAAGLYFGRRMGVVNAVFILATLAACGSGLVYLPEVGLTSAQLVGLFVIFLLGVGAYARYVQGLARGWGQVYAFTLIGALFSNVLIATAQSFLHFGFLKNWAPTQNSPVYVGMKVGLLVVFVGIALLVARRVASAGED